MSEVTRGQVDNENNNQSRLVEHIEYSQGGVYIYESESIAIEEQEHIGIRIRTQESGVYRRETQECYVRTWDRTGTE